MKKTILLTLLISLSVSIFAQTSDDAWTKADKEQLANEAMQKLNAKYPNANSDQKESAASCYVKSIITAYPKKSDWVTEIDIDRERTKRNSLNECLKSSGIEAATPKIEEPKARKAELSKEYLVASWKFGEEEFTFAERGTVLYKNSKTNCSGTWVIEGRTLTINLVGKKLGEMKLDQCSKTKVFEVISYTDNELIVMDNAEKKKLDLTRGK